MVAPFQRERGSNDLDPTPVCCACHRERVGADVWRERTPIAGERLTHGICPACLYALYPDLAPLVRAMM